MTLHENVKSIRSPCCSPFVVLSSFKDGRKIFFEIRLKESKSCDSTWTCKGLTSFKTLLGPSSIKQTTFTRADTSYNPTLTRNGHEQSRPLAALCGSGDSFLPGIRSMTPGSFIGHLLYGRRHVTDDSSDPLFQPSSGSESLTYHLDDFDKFEYCLPSPFLHLLCQSFKLRFDDFLRGCSLLPDPERLGGEFVTPL